MGSVNGRWQRGPEKRFQCDAANRAEFEDRVTDAYQLMREEHENV